MDPAGPERSAGSRHASLGWTRRRARAGVARDLDVALGDQRQELDVDPIVTRDGAGWRGEDVAEDLQKRKTGHGAHSQSMARAVPFWPVVDGGNLAPSAQKTNSKATPQLCIFGIAIRDGGQVRVWAAVCFEPRPLGSAEWLP